MAKPAKTTGKKAPPTAKLDSVQELLAGEEGAALVAEVHAALREQGARLPKSSALTREERRLSAGKLGVEESRALVALLDTVDKHPAVFLALASRDRGADPSRVETGPARRALALWERFAPLAEEAHALSSQLADLQLRLGQLARDLTTPAYAIAKANAPVDAALRASLAPVTDYYRDAAKPSRKAPKPSP